MQQRPGDSQRATDRPRAHGGTSEPEATIFDAAERLLQTTPLHDLTVAQIIREAEVSRGTFYFYFSSKFAVLAGLLERVMAEIFASVQPYVDRPERDDPVEALRRSLTNGTRVWAQHRHLLRAVAEHWHAVPELRTLWVGLVEGFAVAVGAEIERQRATGVAPPGPPPEQLAALLLWGSERCFYIAGMGVDERLPDEEGIVEALLQLWAGAIYSGVAGSPA